MAPPDKQKQRGKDQQQAFEQAVVRQRKRRARAEREKERSIWMGMGMFGLVGWSIALPTLLGLLLGHWLDGRLENGISWTLALMLAGLTLGLFNVWGWMQKTAGENQFNGDEDGDDEA